MKFRGLSKLGIKNLLLNSSLNKSLKVIQGHCWLRSWNCTEESNFLSGFHATTFGERVPGPDWLYYAATPSFVASDHSTDRLQMQGSQGETSDTELLAIADTLISLGGQQAAVAPPHSTVVSYPLQMFVTTDNTTLHLCLHRSYYRERHVRTTCWCTSSSAIAERPR